MPKHTEVIEEGTAQQEQSAVQESTEQSAEQSAPPVDVLFNPFATLSTADTNNEVLALAGRFNKSWRATRNDRITAIVAEYHCSTVEACFAVWLQDDARAIIRREKVRDTADSILNILDEVIGKDAKLALQRIDTLYSDVPVIDRPDVGRRVREQAQRTYTAKIHTVLLSAVYEALKVKESDWM